MNKLYTVLFLTSDQPSNASPKTSKLEISGKANVRALSCGGKEICSCKCGRETSILEASRRADVMAPSPCGGKGVCGKCRVRAEGPLSPLTVKEKSILSPQDIRDGFRLACQAFIRGDVRVFVSSAGSEQDVKILTGTKHKGMAFSPRLRKVKVAYSPSFFKNYPSLIEGALSPFPQKIRANVPLRIIALLQQFLKFEKPGEFYLTYTISEATIANVEKGDTETGLFGMALDIGTTTLVSYLVNMTNGKIEAISSDINPQIAYGGDVLSRISYCKSQPNGTQKLRDVLIESINKLINDLTQRANISPEDICEVAVAGNPTMIHLFMGIDPSSIAVSPFTPVFREPVAVLPGEMGIVLGPGAMIYSLPQISGYIGADTLAGLLVTPLMERKGINLLIDIGTNAEIVISNGELILACAAAAGPALEGYNISSGMKASVGAIERVAIDEDIRLKTIGEGNPLGLCGSGLIDLIAELLRQGVVDSSGRILAGKQIGRRLSKKITDRIVEAKGGNKFLIAEGGQNGVWLLQKDVREVQLAKAAIRAGIEVLLKKLRISSNQIQNVYLAGAFGNYLNIGNAQFMGMLPEDIPIERIRMVGNTSVAGAMAYLLSQRMRTKAQIIAERVSHIELSADKGFTEEFIYQMSFAAGEETERKMAIKKAV
jgi:uncharacterized 2Fe-2S/4Fe-4S cluster protein (DUF4445 family)